jgi:hypothetical protein
MAATSNGTHGRPRPPRVYRGSPRRLRAITPRGNGSAELWLFVAWVAFLLLVALPWMIRHSR